MNEEEKIKHDSQRSNLYELTQEMLEIQNLLDLADIDGVEPLDLHNALAEIKANRAEKIEGCLKIMKNYLALAGSAKKERERIADYEQRLRNKALKIQQWLSLNTMPGESFHFAMGKLYWSKSRAVEPVLPDSPIPECYQRIEISPDKTSMARDMKSGAVIPGWRLVERQHLQIR